MHPLLSKLASLPATWNEGCHSTSCTSIYADGLNETVHIIAYRTEKECDTTAFKQNNYKIRSKAVFGNYVGNVRGCANSKLFTNQKHLKKLVANP